MLIAVFEFFEGIKAIKLYSWEKPYVDKITKLRNQELRQIWKTGLLMSIDRMFFMSGPILMALAGLGTYTALGGKITAAVAFPALALFSILQFPIIVLPWQIMELIYGRIALTRIQKFMNCEETEKEPTCEYSAELQVVSATQNNYKNGDLLSFHTCNLKAILDFNDCEFRTVLFTTLQVIAKLTGFFVSFALNFV